MNRTYLAIFSLITFNLFAQEPGTDLQSFYDGYVDKMVESPKSPEAEAFIKYGDADVSMYSGVPQISIPLHVLKGRDMDLPLSLSYDASGIKVEQMSTPVGLGWNLIAGGRISRLTNGLPDDFNVGTYATIYNGISNTSGKTGISGGTPVKDKVLLYLDNSYISYQNPTFASIAAARAYFDFLQDINNNFVDTQPDYFSVNAFGLNETIVIDYTDGYKAKALNNPRIKISLTRAGGAGNEILGWTVTNEDGSIYEFLQVEYTNRQNTNDQTPKGDFNTTYGSSWVLTEITSANGKDVYEFHYNLLDLWTQAQSVSSASVAVTDIKTGNEAQSYYSTPPHTYNSGVISTSQERILASIEHNGKTLVVVNHANRLDSENQIGSRYESIDFYDFKGYGDPNAEILKSVEFVNNDYFNLDGLSPTQKSMIEIRLKLNGLRIKGVNGSQTFKEYDFEYDRPDDLPSRSCTGQDYFGYYNGKSCSQSLYEKYTSSGIVFDGGNRNPNSYYARIGLLNKITYPTKGYSLFTFEGHKNGGADIGGIRIAEITDYANTGLPALNKKYLYGGNTINYLPNISTIKSASGQAQLIRYATVPSGNEPYVTYSSVIEQRIDNNGISNGQTEYQFYNSGSKGVTPHVVAPFENRFSGNIDKGNLQNKKISDVNNSVLVEETNEYYKALDVLNVPGLVVYQQEELRNQWIFFDEQAGGSVNTIRIDATNCLDIMAVPDPTPEGSPNFYDCSCFVSLNDPACGDERTSGEFNTYRIKKTQAIGQYGGVNKVTTVQYLLDKNAVAQSVTTVNETLYTSQDDGFGNVPVSDNMYLPRKSKMTNSLGDIIETTKFYFQDYNLFPSKNNFTEIVEETSVKNPDSDGVILNKVVKEYSSTSVMSPTKIITYKGNIASDLLLATYNAQKNIQTTKRPNGITTVYLWGYNNRYLVAKVENAALSEIQALPSFSSGLDLGADGLSATQETELRSLSNAMVTTYDYQPLVGLVKISDPRGVETVFERDDFNRLNAVFDEQGNLLMDYQYGQATQIPN